MFFFQSLLLAGYGYAHYLATRLKRRLQVVIHAGLLFVSLLQIFILAFVWRLPLMPDSSWRPRDGSHPMGSLFFLLSVSAGLPYFVLSSTGPLLQSWFSRAQPGKSPYKLYALSNLGSFLALLAYPFVIEPALSLRSQAGFWSAGFFIYSVFSAYVAVRFCAIPSRETGSPEPGVACRYSNSRPGWRKHCLWIGFAACACAMFLATTNRICMDIAVVPFLWVLPLSLYLLSLVICFERSNWYSRGVFHPLFAIAIYLACLLLNGWTITSMPRSIFLYSFILFVTCMVCHGELARAKPDSPHLTSFYLSLALGGAIGGFFVALIAPRLFKGFWEYPIGLWGTALLLLTVVTIDKQSWLNASPLGLPSLAIVTALVPAITSLAAEGGKDLWRFLPIFGLLIGLYVVFRSGKSGEDSARVRAIPLFCAVALVVLGGMLGFLTIRSLNSVAWSTRNFYGVLAVKERDASDPASHAYSLLNGRIIHGLQYVAPEKRYLPTSYYTGSSGIGRAVAQLRQKHATESDSKNLRIGIVGLGIGTIAAYGVPGDYLRFYEINPEDIRIANDTRFFSYLKDCPARFDVVEGDGRISMEEEVKQDRSQQFDLLALDAFSSDAIPIHLLTKEAFQIYLQQLKPHGILAVHITNTYLDLVPPLQVLAEHFRLKYTVIHHDDPPNGYSDWVLLSSDVRLMDSFVGSTELQSGAHEPKVRFSLWTDDYSNLLEVLKK